MILTWAILILVPLLFGLYAQFRVSSAYNKNVQIRADGRVMHKTFLMKVKSPVESKYRGDFYKVMAEMSGEESFKPLSESQCPLVAKK